MNLNNSNIGAWVVEQVPCSFAKPDKNGKPGTHYAMVLLDKNQNVIYIGSECEHRHGDGIQVMHELGGENAYSCYKASVAFRDSLAGIHKAKNQIFGYEMQETLKNKRKELPLMLNAALKGVLDTAIEKHNKRIADNTIRTNVLTLGDPCSAEEDRKSRLLTTVANKVVYNAIGMKPLQSTGRFVNAWNTGDSRPVPQQTLPENDAVRQKLDSSYLPIFNIQLSSYAVKKILNLNDNPDGEVFDKNQLFTTMVVNDDYDQVVFAVRDPRDDRWHIAEEDIRTWAKRNHNPLSRSLFMRQLKVSDGHCLFCNERFDRMSRHVQGARHQSRVVEIVQLACRATSRTGLKMINNRRHSSAFFGVSR